MKRSLLRQLLERVLVGNAPPQPGRNGLLLDLLQPRGHAGFAEILLRQHVGGDLRPLLRHFDIIGMKDDGAVRIADLAGGETESDVRVRRLSLFGVAPLDPHSLPLYSIVVPASAEYPLNIGRRRFPATRRSDISARRTHPCFCLPPQPAGLEPVFVIVRAPGAPLEAKTAHASRPTARSSPANPFWRARPTSLLARRT